MSLNLSITNVHLIHNILLIACRRRVLHPASPLFPSNIMGLCCIKVILLMHSACGMVGHLLGYHLTVFVVVIFQFPTRLAAVTVHSPPSEITTSVILLLLSCLRFVMMLRLNLLFNHLQAKLLGIRLQFVKMIPILISVLLVSGALAINMQFLMSVFLIP